MRSVGALAVTDLPVGRSISSTSHDQRVLEVITAGRAMESCLRGQHCLVARLSPGSSLSRHCPRQANTVACSASHKPGLAIPDEALLH